MADVDHKLFPSATSGSSGKARSSTLPGSSNAMALPKPPFPTLVTLSVTFDSLPYWSMYPT